MQQIIFSVRTIFFAVGNVPMAQFAQLVPHPASSNRVKEGYILPSPANFLKVKFDLCWSVPFLAPPPMHSPSSVSQRRRRRRVLSSLDRNGREERVWEGRRGGKKGGERNPLPSSSFRGENWRFEKKYQKKETFSELTYFRNYIHFFNIKRAE